MNVKIFLIEKQKSIFIYIGNFKTIIRVLFFISEEVNILCLTKKALMTLM